MKISTILTLGIVAIAMAIGRQDDQQLVSLRDHYKKLAIKASQSGISIHRAHSSNPSIVVRRERNHCALKDQAVSDEILAVLRQAATDQETNPKNMEAVLNQLSPRLMSLTSSQAEPLIDGILNDANLRSEACQMTVFIAILQMTADRPEWAVSYLSKLAEFKSQDPRMAQAMDQEILNQSIGNWAKQDPTAAAAWLKKNPELATADSKRILLSSTAIRNPQLALKLIGDLGMELTLGVKAIARTARSTEERIAMIGLLRGHFPTEGNAKAISAGIHELARTSREDPFETRTQWLNASNLAPAEVQAFVDGLVGNVNLTETGKWIGWMDETIPGPKAEDSIRQIFAQWAKFNRPVAEKWLETAPEGRAKNAAAQAVK